MINNSFRYSVSWWQMSLSKNIQIESDDFSSSYQTDVSQVSDGVKKCGRTSPRQKQQNKMLHSRPAWPGHDPHPPHPTHPGGADEAAGRRTWSGMKTQTLIKKTIICKQDEPQLGRNAGSAPVSACSHSTRYGVTVRQSVRCRLLAPPIKRQYLQLRANHLCLSFIITLGVKKMELMSCRSEGAKANLFSLVKIRFWFFLFFFELYLNYRSQHKGWDPGKGLQITLTGSDGHNFSPNFCDQFPDLHHVTPSDRERLAAAPNRQLLTLCVSL